jgi:hypothetical protein
VLRTDLEKGLSTLALSRCHKRMQDQVVGVQRPTRIEGRLRQRRLTHSSAPGIGRSGDWRYVREKRTTADQGDDKKGLTKTAT